MTQPTLICAYCNASYLAGSPCVCGASQRISQARTRQLAIRRAHEKAGIAPKDVRKYVVGGRN